VITLVCTTLNNHFQLYAHKASIAENKNHSLSHNVDLDNHVLFTM